MSGVPYYCRYTIGYLKCLHCSDFKGTSMGNNLSSSCLGGLCLEEMEKIKTKCETETNLLFEYVIKEDAIKEDAITNTTVVSFLQTTRLIAKYE